MDAFAELGLDPAGAEGSGPPSQAEVKAAYQKLLLQYHPDKCEPGTGTERFLRIQAAWEELNTPDKRATYLCAVGRGASRPVLHAENVMLADMELCQYIDEEFDEMPKSNAGGQVYPPPTSAYRRQCRCSDFYEITAEELQQGFNTVQCNGCSLYITVVNVAPPV
jgi:diphthamide biosynthesis protein 4